MSIYLDAIDALPCPCRHTGRCVDDEPIHCDNCSQPCDNARGTNTTPAICCSCLERHYRENAPRGWHVEKCDLCSEVKR